LVVYLASQTEDRWAAFNSMLNLILIVSCTSSNLVLVG
jgi:hypothetical protein